MGAPIRTGVKLDEAAGPQRLKCRLVPRRLFRRAFVAALARAIPLQAQYERLVLELCQASHTCSLRGRAVKRQRETRKGLAGFGGADYARTFTGAPLAAASRTSCRTTADMLTGLP